VSQGAHILPRTDLDSCLQFVFHQLCVRLEWHITEIEAAERIARWPGAAKTPRRGEQHVTKTVQKCRKIDERGDAISINSERRRSQGFARPRQRWER
jgi:hypothetical protein